MTQLPAQHAQPRNLPPDPTIPQHRLLDPERNDPIDFGAEVGAAVVEGGVGPGGGAGRGLETGEGLVAQVGEGRGEEGGGGGEIVVEDLGGEGWGDLEFTGGLVLAFSESERLLL